MRNNLAAWFKITLLFAGLIMIVSSCKKTAGEGGKASIKGKIWVENWNGSFSVLNGTYAGADVDVFIIYGNESDFGDNYGAVGDKQATNYKGEFEFKYLRKGNYKVYVYSKDKTLTSQSGDTVVVKEVKINDKKEKVDLGTITIFD